MIGHKRLESGEKRKIHHSIKQASSTKDVSSLHFSAQLVQHFLVVSGKK